MEVEVESLHVQKACGALMVVAIDSTVLGPTLGGCRWRPYPDSRAARRDALALASAMTRKAALARLPLGGGKAVVRGDPRQRSREQLLAFADFVESLQGRYIAAADMGTGESEMAIIRERTAHVVGLPRSRGGCGDPAPYTARGVFMAMVSALGGSVAGARVAVQGAGRVGGALIGLLLEAGAHVIVCDPRDDAVASLPDEVERVAPAAIAEVPCNVFAPCGPPAVIDSALAARIPCEVLCGAANNPLSDSGVARVLAGRGVLYVPDFLANAGGLIHLSVALRGGDDATSLEHLAVIPENLRAVLARSRAEALDMAAAAEALAQQALEEGKAQS